MRRDRGHAKIFALGHAVRRIKASGRASSRRWLGRKYKIDEAQERYVFARSCAGRLID